MSKPKRTFTGVEARRLMRIRPKAALATLNTQGGGPYVSLANVATAPDGTPIVLISTLAWHTQNLMADPRGSLLFDDTDGLADPLAGARVTVMGRFEKTENPALIRRYLARHPGADLYAGFADFSFWTLNADNAHAVAGFGRIETLEANEILLPEAQWEVLGAAEDDIVQHMNEDHSDAVQLYGSKLLDLGDGPWQMAALDGDGMDLSDGERSHRLVFEQQVKTADQARAVLIQLAKTART